MEGGKGVAKNEGQDDLESNSRNAEGSTFGSSSPHLNKHDVHPEDKGNHNGASIAITCVGVCLGVIIFILILLRIIIKMIGACVIRCIFVCLVGILIASLTVPKLKDTQIWGLEFWKWTIFVLVILYGWLISNWLITIPHALFGVMNLRVVSLYLMYEMKKSVRPFIWLGIILLVWLLLINPGVERSKDATKILDHVTNALVAGLVVAAIWFAKSLLIKLVAFSFQHGRFLDRIKKISFKLAAVGTLLDEEAGKWNALLLDEKAGKWNTQLWGKSKTEIQGDPDEEQSTFRREREKVFARIIEGRFYEMIRRRISDILVDNEDGEQKDMETARNSKVEKKAEADAKEIFKRVAKKSDQESICASELQEYMKKRGMEDDCLPRLFPEARETEKIRSSDLKKLMVEFYKEFEPHLHALNYTRKTLGELDRLASGVAIVIGIIVWCLMMGIFTTRVLVLISSQILLASFMFGNTVKTVFEAIIFVFIMHPFDVGDQCVIDEEQMLVEEIKILYTIFHRNDTQKIFYPNSVLLSKPIRNSFRNPEPDDSVEFNIDLSTSAEDIKTLKEEIKKYLESKPVHWLPNHRVVVKDIDNSGNLKMSLCVTHKINLQSSEEKSSRRSELILALRKILDELKIKYRLLPQEVHVKYVGTTPETTPSASLATKRLFSF